MKYKSIRGLVADPVRFLWRHIIDKLESARLLKPTPMGCDR